MATSAYHWPRFEMELEAAGFTGVVYVDSAGRRTPATACNPAHAQDYCGPYGARVWYPHDPAMPCVVQHIPTDDMARRERQLQAA